MRLLRSACLFPRTPAHQPAPLWSAMIVVSLASPRRRQPTACMSYPARSSGTGASLARFVRWVRLAPPQTEFEPPRVSESPDSPGGHSAPQSAPQNDLPEPAQPHDQLQFPNRSGRSRHGHPAQVRKKIPSITSRRSSAVAIPDMSPSDGRAEEATMTISPPGQTGGRGEPA